MKPNLQEDIINYVVGTFYVLPLTPRNQIEAMVILHYDIPDAEAKRVVGLALVKALEVYRREEKLKQGELRQISDRVNTLVGMTPEVESDIEL